jgi:hypothetical protein
MTNPEFVGTLLIPRYRRFATIDFDAEAVLASRRNLTCSHHSASLFAEVKAHAREIIGCYLNQLNIFGLKELTPKVSAF